jgi:hypothetical protein
MRGSVSISRVRRLQDAARTCGGPVAALVWSSARSRAEIIPPIIRALLSDPLGGGARVRDWSPSKPHEPCFSVIDEAYEHRYVGEVTTLWRWRRKDVHAAGEAGRSDSCGWIRPFGQGKVAYLSLGHRARVWKEAAVKKALGDLVQWCLAGDPQ